MVPNLCWCWALRGFCPQVLQQNRLWLVACLPWSTQSMFTNYLDKAKSITPSIYNRPSLLSRPRLIYKPDICRDVVEIQTRNTVGVRCKQEVARCRALRGSGVPGEWAAFVTKKFERLKESSVAFHLDYFFLLGIRWPRGPTTRTPRVTFR